MFKKMISLLLSVSICHAGLPPTSVKGQSETSPVTTFSFQTPYNSATTTGGATRLIETRNDNFLLNPSFEATLASTSWSNVAGSLNPETTQVHDGKKSLASTIVAETGVILSQSVTPTVKMQGSNLEHSIWINTTVANISVCSLQAGVEIQCQVAPSTGVWTKVVLNTSGPSSGSVGINVKETGTATGTIYFDNAYVGFATNVGTVAQATYYGSLTYTKTASCNWAVTQTTYAADFPANASCATPTVTGSITAPGTKLTQAIVNNAPPGNYHIVAVFNGFLGTTSQTGGFRIVDDAGTQINESGAFLLNTSTTPFTLSGNISYTTAGNHTFKVQGISTSGTANIGADGSNGKDFSIYVYYFPSQSQIAVNSNAYPWYIDATMDGANPSLGTGNVGSYTEITNGSLTLKPQTGTQPVGVMCSSTNAATAPSTSNTTCAAGSESLGINFTIPSPGAYEACWYGSSYYVVNSGVVVESTFELIETPTNAQTLTLEGGTRTQSNIGGMTIATGTNQTASYPMANCSIFNWTTSGTKGIRLMYQQAVAGTPATASILADSGTGSRNMRWTVKPITSQSQTPLLVGSVTSNSTGMERTERAQVTVSNSAAAIVAQSGTWLSVANGAGAGLTTGTMTGFSGVPACSCTVIGAASTSASWCGFTAEPTTTNLSITRTRAGAAENGDINIICQGPR